MSLGDVESAGWHASKAAGRLKEARENRAVSEEEKIAVLREINRQKFEIGQLTRRRKSAVARKHRSEDADLALVKAICELESRLNSLVSDEQDRYVLARIWRAFGPCQDTTSR